MRYLIRVVVGVVLALGAGCDDDRGPEPNRGVERPGRGVATAPARTQQAARRAGPERPGQRVDTVQPDRPFATPDRRGATNLGPDREPPPPAEPGKEGTPKPRDLRAELHDAIPAPAECIPAQDRAKLPGRISIGVQAHISLTGVVTRADVSAPSLPEDAIRCLRTRVESIRLAGPVDGAPMTVRTTLTLERR